MTTLVARLMTRSDTAANWAAANPVLLAGEPALETDTRKEKIGDGVTAWNTLAYRATGGTGSPATTDASQLTTGILPSGRIGDKSITLAKLADEVTSQLGGGGGTMTGRRIAAASELLAVDNGKIPEVDTTTPTTVTIALDVNNNYSTTEYMTEVSQVNTGQVTVAGSVPVATTMQRIMAPGGNKSAGRGASISVRRRPIANIPQLALPTTGIRAWWDADNLTGAAGSAVSSWAETSGAGLPALTQATATAQPVVQIGANGRKGVYFGNNTGALKFLSFTGTALDLARNKANLMVLIVYSTPFAITGDRTLLAMSTGPDIARARVLMQQRDNGAGTMLVGGRRDDAEAGGQYTNAGAAVYPDIAVFGGQFVWSAADVAASKNGVTVNTLATFQTAGNTSDTRSAGGSLGANAAGTLQGFLGTVYAVGFYDNSDTVRAAFQTYAEARWGSQWIIGGNTVA